MKFSKIHIKNFKGINDLTLNLSRQPEIKVFTLVGLNESGKTSILEAIDVLQNAIKPNERHNYIPKGEKISFNGKIEISAEYTWNEKDNQELKQYVQSLGYKDIEYINNHTRTVSYSFEDSEPKTYNVYVEIELNVTKKKSKKVINMHPDDFPNDWISIVAFIGSYLAPEVIYYPDFLFDFPERIYLEDYESNKFEDKKYLEAIEDILIYIKPDLSIEKHLLERMKNSKVSSQQSLESTLGLMSSTVSDVVFSAWERIFKKGNKEIVISHGKEDVGVGEVKHYLEFKLKEGPLKFHINERSLGFRWFFAFLLFTEFRKHRKKITGEILFLLDEPASNLHSTAQKKLLTTFSDLVSNSTLIYTTHSHHLINPEWLNGTFIVKNKALDYRDDFAFQINQTDVEAILYKNFIANHPEQTDYFQPILDTLEYQPGLLEKIPSMVILEGKNDYYTFKYLNKVFFNNKYRNLNFFPGTGATTHKNIIALYLAWNREFVIFLDDDKEGKAAKKTYEKDFGIDVEGKIMTIVDVDKSFLGFATEDLFTQQERLLITQKLFPLSNQYEKSKFNSSLQTLFHFGEKIAISAQTITNFEKVFENLVKKLNITK